MQTKLQTETFEIVTNFHVLLLHKIVESVQKKSYTKS